MPQYETTIESVTQRVITTRDGRASTIYDIVDGSGTKWATFKQPIANESNRLLGQQVIIQGRVETNDRGYQNYFIDDVQGAAAGAPIRANGPVQLTQQAQVGQYIPNVGPQHSNGDHIPPGNPDNAAPSEKDRRIARQTASKVSAQISSDAAGFWQNLDPLVDYFLNGNKPSEYSTPSSEIAQYVERAHQAQYAPAGTYTDPGREAPVPSSDDDIPF